MAKKTTTNKKKTVPAKTKAPRKTKASKAPAHVATTPVGECPRGGEHEWDDSDEGRHCAKCLEPAGAPAKRKQGKAKALTTEAAMAMVDTMEIVESKPANDSQPATGTKLSAIDAAAKILQEEHGPMNTKQMVEAMSARGYWSSPGGKTPHATLYSAILREITVKGDAARFKKTERGHFTLNG